MGSCKHTTALTKVRQICCLGLPSRSFMPMLLAELRAAIPAACGQFIWSSESGRIVNVWSDTLMPRRRAWLLLHHKRYEADAGIRFRELVLSGAPSGNMRRSGAAASSRATPTRQCSRPTACTGFSTASFATRGDHTAVSR